MPVHVGYQVKKATPHRQVSDVGGPNPDQSRSLAQELLIRDQVDYLAGFTFTPNALAVAPLIE